METAEKCLSRALCRLKVHGWRQGARNRAKFNGYNLFDSIVGLGSVVSETEAEALALVLQALDIVCEVGQRRDILGIWNDDPKRTVYDVYRVLEAALDAPTDPRPFYEELQHAENLPTPEAKGGH
jgi:hypothetical protein